MSSQCSMRTSHKMHKEHWLFSFSTSLLDATKTTIFKIGKPNYRFFENRIRQPLQKEFLYKSSILGVPRLIALGEQALADFHIDLTHSSYTANPFTVSKYF